METSRRGFLGGLLASLGSLAVGKDEPALIDTDPYFDTIKGLPCVPVDQWFNHLKPHLWEPRQSDGSFPHDYCVWNRLFHTWRDQIPIFYPEKPVAEAIAKLPVKFPVYELPYKKLDAQDWDNKRKSEVPLFFATNQRIQDHKGGRWLVIDVICGKEELPLELQHLTQYRTNQIVDYLTSCHAGKPREELPWPQYWGVSGMSCDFWPVCDGKCELEPEGLRVLEIASLINYAFISASPYGDPTRLTWVWMGNWRSRLDGYGGIAKATDHPEDPWNPLKQIPERFRTYSSWPAGIRE